MRDALEIRYHTGNKLILQQNGCVVGILGDTELYHALLGKNLEKSHEESEVTPLRTAFSQAG